MSNQDLHCRNFTTKRSEPVYSNNGKLMIDSSDIDTNLNLLNDSLTRVTPTSTVSEAIPVRLMVGIAGQNFNPLRSIGNDLAVYLDDMNPDAVNNSGISKASLQTDANNKLDLMNNSLTRVNPTTTVSEAIPVRLMVGIDGENFNPLRSIGSDLAVYLDDMNPDAVNNSGISKASLQTDANNKLDLMSLESTQLNVLSNVVSTRTNTSDTAINTLGISNDTTSINSKITSGNNNTLSTAQQVLLYGRTSGGGNNLHSVLVTGSGHLVCDVDNFPTSQQTMALSIPVTLASDQNDINVKQNSVVNLGSFNNINNNSNISPGELSTLTANIANMRDCTIIYTDFSPDNFDSIGVQVSGDGVNFHEVRTIFTSVPSGETNRSGFVSFNVAGFTLVRIKNKSSVYVNQNANCSVYGSP